MVSVTVIVEGSIHIYFRDLEEEESIIKQLRSVLFLSQYELFIFDCVRINEEDTAKDLELKDGSIIDGFNTVPKNLVIRDKDLYCYLEF